MRDLHVDFQLRDFDDDIVGICLTIVVWMRWIFNKSRELNFEIESEPEKPSENFFKHQPHFPRHTLRVNCRNILAAIMKNENDDIKKYKNIFTCLLAITYIYHMPSQKMYDIAKNNEDFDREKATKLLLDDNMSPNWLEIPKPSKTDFSGFII